MGAQIKMRSGSPLPGEGEDVIFEVSYTIKITPSLLNEIRVQSHVGAQLEVVNIIKQLNNQLRHAMLSSQQSLDKMDEIQQSPVFKVISGNLFEFLKNSIEADATELQLVIKETKSSVHVEFHDNAPLAKNNELLKLLKNEKEEFDEVDYSLLLEEKDRSFSSKDGSGLGGKGIGLKQTSQYLSQEQYNGALLIKRDDKKRGYIEIVSPKTQGDEFSDYQRQSHKENFQAMQNQSETILSLEHGSLFAKRKLNKVAANQVVPIKKMDHR